MIKAEQKKGKFGIGGPTELKHTIIRWQRWYLLYILHSIEREDYRDPFSHEFLRCFCVLMFAGHCSRSLE